jgi:putative peptidoglycan lipid II flippase
VKKNSVPIIMLILVFSKILGFLKLRLIAQLFGATRELDLFWAAFAIPDTLFNIIIAGSVNAAIIPVFSKVLNKKGEAHLCKLYYRLNTIFLICIVLLSLLAFIFAPQIAGLLVGKGFSVGLLQTAADITVADVQFLSWLIRIMLLSPMFLGLSSLLSAYLQIFKNFFVTAVAPLVYNLVVIVIALLFVSNRGMGVEGIAWATVFGSVFHLLSQIPAFIKLLKRQGLFVHHCFGKIRQKLFGIKEDIQELIEIVKLAVPRIIGVFGEQINVFVNTFISFTLSGGALSAYRFAFSLHLFPVQIVGGAMSLVALPNLAEAFSQGKMQIFKEIYNKAIQRALFLILPMMSIILVLRLPLVRLAYGVGEFDWWATIITSWCLFLLSFAVLGQVLASLSLRAFYAIHETRIPLLIIFLTIVVNIIGSYYFTNFFSHYFDWRPLVAEIADQIRNGAGFVTVFGSIGDLLKDVSSWFTTRSISDAAVGGLALSTSVSFLFEATLYVIFLNKKVKIISWYYSVKPFLKKMFCAFVMMILMYLAFRLTDFNLDTTKSINVLMILITTSALGLAVYILLSRLLKVEEFSILTGYSKVIYTQANPKKLLTELPLVMSDYASFFRIKMDSLFKKNKTAPLDDLKKEEDGEEKRKKE